MSKADFTDDREKQEPIISNGDGRVDSDDSHCPDLIINELINEGKTPSVQFAKLSLIILFASSHRSPA
jgi:hypothetical protein